MGPSAGFSETFPRYHGLSKNGHLRFGDLCICPGSSGVAFGGRWKYPWWFVYRSEGSHRIYIQINKDHGTRSTHCLRYDIDVLNGLGGWNLVNHCDRLDPERIVALLHRCNRPPAHTHNAGVRLVVLEYMVSLGSPPQGITCTQNSGEILLGNV